nr:hypothetical protein [Kribbella qitaiheensis]
MPVDRGAGDAEFGCDLGDGVAPPSVLGNFFVHLTAGLIAVPVGADAAEVSCVYRATGTSLGLAIGATTLLAMAALACVLALRRRQLATAA